MARKSAETGRFGGTDSLPSTPQGQCNLTHDNHGLQGSINADYRRSARPKKLAITGIASLSEVFGIYPGSWYQDRAEGARCTSVATRVPKTRCCLFQPTITMVCKV